MKMIFERLIPGMKHSGNPQSSAQTSLAKLKERFADGFEQKSQQNLFVGENQTIKFVGQGEDQMEISHRQKLRGLPLQPLGFGQGLAFGAVAVTAGVISRVLKTASVALL